jgi:hypothetical protein
LQTTLKLQLATVASPIVQAIREIPVLVTVNATSPTITKIDGLGDMKEGDTRVVDIYVNEPNATLAEPPKLTFLAPDPVDLTGPVGNLGTYIEDKLSSEPTLSGNLWRFRYTISTSFSLNGIPGINSDPKELTTGRMTYGFIARAISKYGLSSPDYPAKILFRNIARKPVVTLADKAEVVFTGGSPNTLIFTAFTYQGDGVIDYSLITNLNSWPGVKTFTCAKVAATDNGGFPIPVPGGGGVTSNAIECKLAWNVPADVVSGTAFNFQIRINNKATESGTSASTDVSRTIRVMK